MNVSRLQKTFIAILTGRGIMAVRQIVLVPILLRAWGADLYGQWLVLSAIPSFLAMSNLGLGTSAQIKIAMNMAGDQDKDVCVTITTAFTAILSIAAIASVFVFTLIPYFYREDLQANQIDRPQFILLFLILTLFVKMLGQPLSGVWTGAGRPSYAGHAGNICSIVELAFSIIIPLLGGGPFMLTLLLLGVNVLWLIIFGAATLSILQNQRQLLCKPDFSLARQLIGVGLGHQIGPLWQAILFQGSILLANSAVGPVGAAMWGSLRVLCRCGNQILELVTQSLGPEFQLSAGRDDKDGLRRLFATGLVASLLLSSCIAIGLMVVGPYFFKIWTHSSYYISWVAWLMMSTALLPFSLWWLAGELHRATNNAWLLNLAGIVAATVSVGLMWVMRGGGLTGLACGSLIFEVMMMLAILPLTLKRLSARWKEIITEGISEIYRRLPRKLKAKTSG